MISIKGRNKVTDVVWNCTTVATYAEESSWPMLFDKVVIPFIHHLTNKNLIKSYLLTLYPGRFVIRFVINPDIRQNLATEFKTFVISNNPAVNAVKTIRHRNAEDNNPLIANNIISEDEFFPGVAFSEIVLNLVVAQGYNEFVRLSLAIYLHFGWIRTKHKVYREPMSTIILKGYCWTVTEEMQQDLLLWLNTNFVESKTELEKLYTTFFFGKKKQLEKLPAWVLYWLSICDNQTGSNIARYFDRQHLYEISNYIIPAAINRYLGLLPKEALLITYYVNQVIVNVEKKRSVKRKPT